MEDAAFLFVHELEDVVREWIALVYHRCRQSGLAVPEWPLLQLSPNEMYEAGVARAGLLRIPAVPGLAYEFLEVHPRTIQHYGVEVGGLRYNGPALDPYRNSESPYGGRYAGRWPVRVNPDDVRWAWFMDPADDSWHRLEWEHAAGLGTPFSGEAARYARQLAARHDRHPDAEQALARLLARWDQGMVTGRRERRMAIRLASERASLPDPAGQQAARIAVFPQAAAGAEEPPHAVLNAVPDSVHDDGEPGKVYGDREDDDFYADAFEVLE